MSPSARYRQFHCNTWAWGYSVLTCSTATCTSVKMSLARTFVFSFLCLCLKPEYTVCVERCAAPLRGTCAPGWTQWRDQCYHVTGRVTYNETTQECTTIGSAFVAPKTQEENEFMRSLMKPDYWINCNNLNVKSRLHCLTSLFLTKKSFFFLRSNQKY